MKKFAYAACVVAAAFVIAIASASTGEAKAKKKAAAAAPLPPTCWGTAAAPVCASRGKLKFTYINSCYAGKDGAKVVSQKACPVKKAKKAKKAKKKAAKKK